MASEKSEIDADQQNLKTDDEGKSKNQTSIQNDGKVYKQVSFLSWFKFGW